MSTKRLWGLTIVRLGLLAAFLLCNLHNTKLPVVFKNDAFPVAFMVVRPSPIPSLCTPFTRAGIEWRC